ncbi:hypothetical protein [Streptomyces sp. NBC_01304]|uniref:hypothetical protein n=1 Tax=Streptomyces sp. NBC_01304 TaxID=2903818 RepID=UPI002E0FBD4E|nr:hypothetical protein OG430_40835 [Streptomyces sp. NBC_01304]
MLAFKRTAAAALITTLAVVGATFVTTTTASAASSWKCEDNSHEIDDNNYDGPWPDNWDVTVNTCIKRSGSYVYVKSHVSWDGPTYGQVDDSGIFDSAHLTLRIRNSKRHKTLTYYGIERALENSNSNANYNGSYDTRTYKWRAGSYRTHVAPTLYLNWNNDGDGDRGQGFAWTKKV